MKAAADRLLLRSSQALLIFFLAMGGRTGRSLPMSWTTFYTYCDHGERGTRNLESGLNGDTFGRWDSAWEDKREY